MKGKLAKIDKDKLPVYQIVVEDDDNTGISLISLVDEPAITVKGMAFGQESSLMSFKEVGDDKQIIVGPALIPNMKIYREDDKYGQYYVVFTKETILKMVEKFNKYGSNRKINIDHSNQMVDAFIMEDWIIEDEVYDKSRIYGIEAPVGTYMIMVKVENKEFWDAEVKNNGKFGFSIEGLLGQQLVSMSKQQELTIDDLTEEDLLEIFELKTWRSTSDSSNVDKMKYQDETKELVIKFNDGSYYTYFDIDFDTFLAVMNGEAECITDGENEYGSWFVGKTPSVGAAVWQWLIETGARYERGGTLR